MTQWRGGGADAPIVQSATYTTVSDGTVVNGSATGAKWFGLQVTGVGATPTSWTVNLRGSALASTGFVDLATHSNGTDGDGDFAWPSTPSLVNYFYVEVEALTLGSATGILVTVIAAN